MPRFLARQAEAIVGAGPGHLVTGHSQTYPQFLGISRFPGMFAGLALERGERQNGRLLNKRGCTVFSIIQAAGWPIWPLLLASVISVALIIERLVALRRPKVVPSGLLQRVVGEFKRGANNDRMLEELERHSPLGRVLAAGLRNVGTSREVMKESIEEAGSAVSHELNRYLTTLGTIASISPLMGLFGTVVGMIEIFGSQSPTGANPMQLAHGISIALYNTGFGIFIAIPSLIFWRHFRALVDGFVVEMEQQAVRLVEYMHGDRK
jgi:biopolymer transport protein ExbB